MNKRSFLLAYILSVSAVAVFGIVIAAVTIVVLFFGSFLTDAPNSPAAPGAMLVIKVLGAIANVYAWPAQKLVELVINIPFFAILISFFVAPLLWGFPVAVLWRKWRRKAPITPIGT